MSVNPDIGDRTPLAAVLCDLDGTLIDSGRDITAGVPRGPAACERCAVAGGVGRRAAHWQNASGDVGGLGF